MINASREWRCYYELRIIGKSTCVSLRSSEFARASRSDTER